MYSPKEGGREEFRLLACFPAWWWVGSVVSRGVGVVEQGTANNNSKNGNKARLSTMKLL